MLRVDNIDVYYDDVQALWDISFEVKEGEVVALLGSNGAGKTTTLNAISGLLRPRQGNIEFLEQELTKLPAHKTASFPHAGGEGQAKGIHGAGVQYFPHIEGKEIAGSRDSFRW
jgi:ABC-type branched-subunit amino acid transport system ATPase component